MQRMRATVTPRAARPATRSRRERLVALLPAACAVHCLLTPFLAVAVPVIALSPPGEWLALSVSAILAVWAVRTTARAHRVRWVWLPVLLGITLWAVSLSVMGDHHVHGEAEWVAGLGGLILAGGVVWSSRLRHRRVCGGGDCVV